MKYCSTILVGLLCTAACLAQTPLPESRRTSPEIFIYKPDARELRELHVKGKAPDEGMLHTFVGKYTASGKIPQLPRGNYLRVWTDGNKLVYGDHVVDNFYYRLVRDEQVMLILCDTLGNIIDDAVVKRGSKRMKYDPGTRTYNLPRIRGEEATVEVNNDGVLHYITIGNEPDYTYRPGFFKTAWGKVKTAFKRVFAPGKLPARDKYDGFVVFSKPRYKPGETVKFKAHINRKGKPLDGKVDVALVSYYSPSIDTTLVSLAPYRPGMYEWEFRLSDSLRLRLDKDYTLRFRTGDKHANDITGRFRYEEYELGKLTFTARADKQKYARGDTVRISLSAVDENNMPVYDGRVKVLVKPARYMGCKFLARTAFVPDRLWEHTFDMEGKSTKEIILPDSIFVDGVSMYYNVACSFFDAGNERRDERISLYRDARRRRIDYSAGQGMLALRELYDGKSVESRALVTAYNPEYGIVWQDSVTLPCSVPLSWIVSEYEVQSATASEDIEVGKLPGELIGHRFFRRDGTVRLVVDNPAKFPFWYTICMGDKTIAKGYATELDFARKDNGRKGYSMQIAYLQGENARTIRGELPFTEKNISMEVTTAATVYPGQSAKVEVAVKDRKGRPVKNADVTAYAFTSKFEALPPAVAIYGKSASGKAITPKNYEADEEFLFNIRTGMDWPLWRQRMGLDSIEYYKFLYPEPFYAYTEEAPGRLTQLSPYVVVDGEVQGIHVLWIDEQPHYFKQAQQLTPYSFPIWPGLHTLRLRTHDREVTVENVYAGEGLKTIVSVDGGQSAVRPGEAPGDNRPVRISVREYDRKEKGMLTQRETALLTRHMITVDNTFGKATLLTGQPDRQSSYSVETELPGIINAGGVCYYLNGTQKQTRRYRRYRPQAEAAILAGPFPYRGFTTGGIQVGTLYSDTLAINSFEIEGGYRYDIRNNYLKLQSWEQNPIQRQLEPFTQAVCFGQDALTAEAIRGIFRRRLADMVENESGLISAVPPISLMDSCRLQLAPGKLADGTRAQPIMVLLQSTGKYPASRLYYGTTTEIDRLPEGNLRVDLIFRDTTRCSATIRLRKGGINYLRMDSLVKEPADDRSRALCGKLERMLRVSRPAAPLADYKPAEAERDNPLRNPGRISEANLTGKVVTGTVRDPDGEPIAGASVQIDGTDTGTVTDTAGKFTLSDTGRGTLVVSYIGYRNFATKLISGYDYNIVLEEDYNALDEVVVVAYGKSGKRAVVGSRANSATVTTEVAFAEFDEQTETLPSTLAGMAAGIQVRGAGTIAGQAPMIVVNGVPYDGALSDFDRGSILSMNLVRDANTAIYGARAANGIIFIETSERNAAGGDGFPLEAGMPNTLRTDFHDDAFWKPRLTTDKAGRLTFEVTYPDDITSWDANFIAVGGRRQADRKHLRIKSYKPLNAQLSVPRFAIAGDSLNAAGRLTNHTGDTLSVRRTIETDGRTAEKQIRIATSHTDAIPAVAGDADSIRIVYSLTTPGGYFDGERRAIPIYKAGILETHGEFAVLNDTAALRFTPDPALGTVTIHAEASAMQAFLDEIENIDLYPHLCNEQMASKVKALLSKKRIYTLFGRKFKDDDKVTNLLRKLTANQNDGKLWGWWNREQTELWISQQVVEALLDAETEGYKTGLDRQALTDALLAGLNRRMPAAASDSTGMRKNELLSLVGLLRKLDARIDYPRYCAFIASIPDATLGNRLRTAEMLQQFAPDGMPAADSLLALASRTMMGSLYWRDKTPREPTPRRFAQPDMSDVENTLTAYRILRAAGNRKAELEKIRNYFFEQRKSGSWRNTYESSRIVETIMPDMLEKDGGTFREASLTIDGQRFGKFPLTRTYEPGKEITVRKEGSMPVFFTAYQQAWNDKPKPAAEGFSVSTRFRKNGKPVTTLHAGERVELVATVTADSDAEYVMVEIPIPAGCSYDSKEKGDFWKEAHREYYKEKVAVFCNKLRKGTHTFTVRLLPRYTGSYRLNPARAELMYYPVFHGRNEMKKCGVAEAQEAR